MRNASRKRHIDLYLLLAATVALTCCGSAALAINIPTDTSVGTWDSANRIYTLNTDVYDTIQIVEDDLTLDGAGYTVSSPSPPLNYGIYLYSVDWVVVKNVTIEGFVYGILVSGTSANSSKDNELRCNVISNNNYGIYVGLYAPWNTVTGNTVSSSTIEGISLFKSGRTIVRENTMSNNAYGLRINDADNGEINNNNFIDNTVQATIAYSSGNVFNQNHWNEWTTPDNDSDGFVDNPYVFTGGQDDQPRVEPVPSPCAEVLEVDIDIKPGSYPNAINLGSYGLIPVAILSSEEFDATTVNPETVELAGAGVAVRGKSNKYMAHEEDVDGDGLVDLVTQVATENLDPGQFQDGSAVVTGATYEGQQITGTDEITIVPPE
jgi:parallel beta-helix repeat protein